MAEQEELQLRVSLDDQASAQLAALRGQLDQMRGGSAAAPIVAAIAPVVQQLTAMVDQLAQLPAQITSAMSSAAQGLGQVQTQLTQISAQIQQSTQAIAAVPGHVAQGAQGLAAAMRKASFEGSAVGGFLGNLAGGAFKELLNQLSQLGNNLIMRATDFHGLSDSMKDLETHATGVGRTMTGYQSLERQLQLGGMSPEQARAAISRQADISGEIKQYGGAENTPLFHRLTQFTDRKTTQSIYDAMKQMEDKPLEEQINEWIKLKENVKETMTRLHKGEQFEAAWKEIEDAGAPKGLEQLDARFRARRETTSPAREENLRARTEETRKFNYESLKASFLWKDIGESLAGSLLHGLGLNTGLVEMNTWLERIRDRVLDFEKTWREVSFQAALDQLAQLEPAMKPFTDEIKNLIKDIGEIGKELKAVWDWMQQLGKTVVDPDVATKIQRHQMKQEGMSDEQIDKYLKEHPLQPDDKTKPYTWEQMQEWWRGGKKPEPPKPALDPNEYLRNKFNPPGVPEKQIQDYENRLKGKLPDEQFDPLSGLPLGPKKPEVPVEGKPIIVPPIEVKPQQPEQKTPSWYERKMRGREAPTPQPLSPSIQLPAAPGFASFQQAQFREPSPWDTTPTPPPPGPNEARAANVEPNRFRNFPRSTHIEDRRPPGGGEYHSTLDLDAAEKRQQFIKEYNEKLKSPEGKAWLKGGEGAIGQIQLGKPSTGEPLDKITEGLDKYLYGLAQKHGWTSEQKSKAGAPRFGGEDGSSFDERFGTWPSTGADKLDQTSNKLDQAANTNVNISGAGKIQVDVRAPPGTSVDASGEGFFKSTEITRLTQMLPADMGPLPMTGVGAGQGVAGNGTVSA